MLTKFKYNLLANITVYEYIFKGGFIMSDKIGVINEIGDMGLGFDELSESDAKVLKEQEKKEQERRSNTASK